MLHCLGKRTVAIIAIIIVTALLFSYDMWVFKKLPYVVLPLIHRIISIELQKKWRLRENSAHSGLGWESLLTLLCVLGGLTLCTHSWVVWACGHLQVIRLPASPSRGLDKRLPLHERETVSRVLLHLG